ncbi:unnamed protein product [Rhizophagus irregularis]|nr:unnamed protein product [Rhizophagus irregularis]
MHNWDEQVEQEIPLQGPLSYAEAAKKIKTVPNVRANVLTSSQGPFQSYKGKGKQQETRDPNVLPNVQTRTLSPMEEDNEVNKIVETEKFIYEPSTALGTSPSSPKNQEGNTQRLDNFEAKMDQAFSMLTNTTGNLTFI